MISVEKKLQVFTQYLLKKERKWGKDIVNDAKEKRIELLAASDKKMEKDRHSIEERSYHIIYRDKNKTIADGKNKAKTRELEEKNKLLMDFNQLILLKAKDFLDTEIYFDFLTQCVKDIPEVFKEKKDLIIFLNLREKDIIEKLVKEVLPDYRVEYKEQNSETIGGIIVQDNANRIHCDFTVDNLIKTNYKQIGMTLNGFMKGQVK